MYFITSDKKIMTLSTSIIKYNGVGENKILLSSLLLEYSNKKNETFN
jgi:hypothetical protein